MGIDPCHTAAILDLKRGSTGMSNAHAIFRMHIACSAGVILERNAR